MAASPAKARLTSRRAYLATQKRGGASADNPRACKHGIGRSNRLAHAVRACLARVACIFGLIARVGLLAPSAPFPGLAPAQIPPKGWLGPWREDKSGPCPEKNFSVLRPAPCLIIMREFISPHVRQEATRQLPSHLTPACIVADVADVVQLLPLDAQPMTMD